MTECLVALGGNVGDVGGTFAAALDLLAAHDDIGISAVSRCFVTEPVGEEDDEVAQDRPGGVGGAEQAGARGPQTVELVREHREEGPVEADDRHADVQQEQPRKELMAHYESVALFQRLPGCAE
mgnify:CR=1 FL=1